MPFDSAAYALFTKKKADLINGKVPLAQLPSYVSNVIEVDTYDDLPQTGESNVIYVTKDTGNSYRWVGIHYISVSETKNYISVKVDSNHLVTMSDLKNYVDNIDEQELHVFFDFSDFIDKAHTCTVLFFEEDEVKYCIIYDIINNKDYIDYNGYTDDETVYAYVNRTGNDIINVIKINDEDILLGELIDIVNKSKKINQVSLFTMPFLGDYSHLYGITVATNDVTVIDIIGCKTITVAYDAVTPVADIIESLDKITTERYVDVKTHPQTLSSIFRIESERNPVIVNDFNSNDGEHVVAKNVQWFNTLTHQLFECVFAVPHFIEGTEVIDYYIAKRWTSINRIKHNINAGNNGGGINWKCQFTLDTNLYDVFTTTGGVGTYLYRTYNNGFRLPATGTMIKNGTTYFITSVAGTTNTSGGIELSVYSYDINGNEDILTTYGASVTDKVDY